MSELYLSRLSLRRDASVACLAELLVPDRGDEHDGAPTGAAHRLIWSAFTDGPDRKRDFLWRQDQRRWLVLSHRPPHDPHRLFDIETKPFAPDLEPKQKLTFALRVNAVVTRKNAHGRPQRSDVVMDRLRAVPANARAKLRHCLACEAGSDWLAIQAPAAGFDIDAIEAVSYRTEQIPRRGAPIALGILDLAGTIFVTEPERFLPALAAGFGKAKAFGCGLMLIRRAR